MKQGLWTLLLVSAVSSAQGIDLAANETPLHTARDEAAIAKIPASFKFVEPGTLTVAISALNSPPLALIVRRSTAGDLHAVEAKLMRAHTANNVSLIRPTKLSGLRTLSSTRQGQLQLFSINRNTIF